MGASNLSKAMELQGLVGRVVSAHHAEELEADILARHEAGLFDEEFFRERLTGFVFSPPESLSRVRSLIVVAVPQPQVRFTFTWRGRQRTAIVPPTYLHWEETDRQVEAGLAEIVEREGYGVAQARLPKKLLAVRSGLARYGRNNVTYVLGMGSFHRLVVLWSDRPCEAEAWYEPRVMARCESCRACLRSCPSGAIAEERFLLRAERCIVFHNEQVGDVPFPAWMDASWHNCLVGCMVCQTVCPLNEEVHGWIEEGAAFSAEETDRLMDGVPLELLAEGTLAKLEAYDLVDLYDVMPRNLGALFAGAAGREQDTP